MMKKLTALIVAFVFVMTMVLAMPVMAEDTAEVTPIELQATSANGSTTGSFGSNYASLSSGNGMTFKVTLAEAGQYSLVSRQITWVKGVQYKVYINEKPMGIVDAGNTLNAQETTNAELGTFDLCAGYNEIRLQVIGEKGAWIYKLTLTRLGDMSGDFISVNANNTDSNNSVYAGKSGVWSGQVSNKGAGQYVIIKELASAGYYDLYVSGRNVPGSAAVIDVYDNATTNTSSDFSNKVLSAVTLPALGEYNSVDTVCIGRLYLTAGYHKLLFLTNNTPSGWKPAAFHFEKAASFTETSRSTTWGGYSDITSNDTSSGYSQPSITFSGLKPGTYEVIGSAASWSSDNKTSTGETITAHIFTQEGSAYPTQEFSFIEKGFTTWVHNIKMGEVTVTGDSKTIYFIKRLGNSGDLRIANVILVKKPIDTRVYIGESATPAAECSTLTMAHATVGTNRKGKITVQTTLPDESRNAIMIAVLYENGEMVSAVPVTTKDGATLTGTLDASGVSNINTCYVKVFVWDSLDNLTPLAKVMTR